jgi:hypothetical protein
MVDHIKNCLLLFQINRSFNVDEAKKSLRWIAATSGETIQINGIEDHDKMMLL